MGTTDPELATDPKGCDLGWRWRPNRSERRKLYKLKAEEGEDCDPNGPFDEYYPDGCSWLKHRVMKICKCLGPVSKHYKAPTTRDAMGWSEEW